MITQPGCVPTRQLHLTREALGHHVVRLQKPAAQSLLKVNKEYRGSSKRRVDVQVISSYRSCADQRRVCSAMPGCTPNGCPGRCAEPGHSFHQIGLAVDVAPPTRLLDRVRLRRKFYAHGWHNFSSNDSLRATGSDPWHFTYRVTG